MAQTSYLDQFQWKNRLILIVSNEKSTESFESQMQVLGALEGGFDERKLLVIHIKKDQFKLINQPNNEWILNSDLYEQFNTQDKNFQTILIGLDGGVKLRRNEVVSKQEIFDLIDSMPMRRAEMRRRN